MSCRGSGGVSVQICLQVRGTEGWDMLGYRGLGYAGVPRVGMCWGTEGWDVLGVPRVGMCWVTKTNAKCSKLAEDIRTRVRVRVSPGSHMLTRTHSLTPVVCARLSTAEMNAEEFMPFDSAEYSTSPKLRTLEYCKRRCWNATPASIWRRKPAAVNPSSLKTAAAVSIWICWLEQVLGMTSLKLGSRGWWQYG